MAGTSGVGARVDKAASTATATVAGTSGVGDGLSSEVQAAGATNRMLDRITITSKYLQGPIMNLLRLFVTAPHYTPRVFY